MIRKPDKKTERVWKMAKKHGRKSAESLNKGARSSVGRAPQWHSAGPGIPSPRKTKLNFPKEAEVFEIPEGWEPATAMRMVDDRPFLYRVLRRITPKRLENDLKARKGRSA